MPDHSRTFALITLRGLADMLADAADKIAAQSPKAQAIIDTNTRPVTGYGMAGCAQVFQNLDSAEHFKRMAAQTIQYLRKNRLVLKRTGRNHSAADARWLAKVAGYRRDAQARTQSPPPPPSSRSGVIAMPDTLGNYDIAADLFTQADDRPARLAVSKRRDGSPELCMTAPGSTGETIMSESEFEGFVSMTRRMFRQAEDARTAYENGTRGAGVDDEPPQLQAAE